MGKDDEKTHKKPARAEPLTEENVEQILRFIYLFFFGKWQVLFKTRPLFLTFQSKKNASTPTIVFSQ